MVVAGKGLRERLAKEMCYGMCFMYPSPGAIERVGPDWDWIWVDSQHGLLGYRDVLDCVRASDLANRPAIVRVPDHSYGVIGRTLDTGAAGVMVPVVESAEQARAIVEAAKFPPLGKRSYGGRRPIDLHGRGYTDSANEQTLLVIQIETRKGLENVEAIAAVPGVDVLFFGPDDVALERGLPMDTPRSDDFLAEELRQVAAAAEQAGIACGTTISGPGRLQFAAGLGYRLCVVAGDVRLLAGASEQASQSMRSALKDSTQP